MYKLPIGMALISAVLFGAATPASKLLLEGFTPFQLAGLLYLGAALAVAAGALRQGGLALPRRSDRRNRYLLLGAVLSGGVLGPLALLFGLRLAQASSVSLWLNLELAATAVLGVVLSIRSNDWSHTCTGRVLDCTFFRSMLQRTILTPTGQIFTIAMITIPTSGEHITTRSVPPLAAGGPFDLRKDIEKLDIPNVASPSGNFVTASLGVATFKGDDSSTRDTLLSQADTAMYQAKEQGRNRVNSFNL